MVPATTTPRRLIPATLHPDELVAASSFLRASWRQGALFWTMLPLMTVGLAWGLALADIGLLTHFLLTLAGGTGLAAGRIGWWWRQRPIRAAARQTIDRWRRLPNDRRWDAAMVLLDRIDRLGAEDPALRETARRLVTVLFSLYEDIRALDRTIAADRILDGDPHSGSGHSERYYRLLAVRTRREAQIDALLNGLRDLHLEMNEQLADHIGPLQDRLQELMDRLEADREVVRLMGDQRRALRQHSP